MAFTHAPGLSGLARLVNRDPHVLTAPRRLAGRWRALRLGACTLAVATLIAPSAHGQPRGGVSNAREARATLAGNEIDRLMQRVFDTRDAAWRRVGDFILRETLTLEIEAPIGVPWSGLRHEYEWYVRDGVGVRSPVRVDGLDIDEETRRVYEAAWRRENAGRRTPEFIRESSYFMFGFEPGSYYFAGRGTVAGREVVRIEYYPTRLVGDELSERISRGFSRTSLVTFWVDPEALQIVKYTLDNPGLVFLRFRWLGRVDGLEASVDMTPIGDVWMPARVTISGLVTTALGRFHGTVTREFSDYREAETGARLVSRATSRNR